MKKQHSSYRWIVFTIVLSSYIFIVSQRTAPGLITDQLMKDFGVTAATIGLLTSFQFLAYASLQVPIGILSDRYGPNLFLIIGTMLNGIGTLMYSMAPNEWLLLIARLLVGTGDATIWINLVLILSQWFTAKEFIKLLGMAGMGGSLGFLFATFPFSLWIAHSGWRASFFTMGILIMIIGLLLYLVLMYIPKRYLPASIVPSKKESSQPQEKTIPLLKRLLSTRQAWATFLCHFGVVGTYVGFIGSWAVPYGMDILNMSRSEASQLIMLGLVGSLIGAPLSSWLASRLHTIRRPYLVSHFLVVICWSVFLLFQGKPPVVMVIILFLLIGYGNGSSALTFAVVRQSFPVKEVGVVSGFANMGGFLSAVLLPSLFGKALDHFTGISGYQVGFMIPVLFSVCGLIGAWIIREQQQALDHS